MAVVVRKIIVPPDSELAHLLDEAAKGPLLLEKDGQVYRLSRETDKADIWANYDPQAVIEALHKVAGTWASPDVDAIIADLYRAREEGSRPLTRP